MRRPVRSVLRAAALSATLAVAPLVAAPLAAQPGQQPDTALRAQRWAIEKELAEVAVVERKVMLPMRDGVRLATDIYRPKNATGPVPTIFSKTPYNFNYWDVRLGAPRATPGVKRSFTPTR